MHVYSVQIRQKDKLNSKSLIIVPPADNFINISVFDAYDMASLVYLNN